MLSRGKAEYYVADFETTVFEGQTFTQVWSAAYSKMFDNTEDVTVRGCIEDFITDIINLKKNVVCYFHNLSFDGSFILSFLKSSDKWREALTPGAWIEDKNMPRWSYKYIISEIGQWYMIKLRTDKAYIEFRDSYKLIPFSLDKIGKDFQTKHRKSTMQYKGFRYANCPISDSELEYIKNDILVMKEALEMFMREGHSRLTIASCAMAEFKESIGGRANYDSLFPNLVDIDISNLGYKELNAWDWIHRAYRGAWCYLVKGKDIMTMKRPYRNGITLDVCSLYPSVMTNGYKYPYGLPHFWKGEIPYQQLQGKYWFVRFRTRFYLKPNKLPFIQIKNSWFFKGNECLEDSDVWNKDHTEKIPYYLDVDGNKVLSRYEFTMTMTDWKLFNEHYYTRNLEIIGGCWFDCRAGFFDAYIAKYKWLKQNNTGSKRAIAKMLQNALYGRFAQHYKSNCRVIGINEDTQALELTKIIKEQQTGGYIPVGAAITSYAREFTIRAAQLNYYGRNKAGFIYADTDSLHLDIPIEQVKGVKLHESQYLCWKLESSWDEGYFVRQKTYCEVNGDNIDIKCAGLPERSKRIFIETLTHELQAKEGAGKLTDDETYFMDSLNEREREYIKQWHTLNDFKPPLEIPGKLVPRQIEGGVLLTDTIFTFR